MATRRKQSSDTAGKLPDFKHEREQFLKKLGEEIRRKMDAKNLTLLALERLTGIGKTSISEYTNGNREPGMFSMLRLKRVLDLDMDLLLEVDAESAREEKMVETKARAQLADN